MTKRGGGSVEGTALSLSRLISFPSRGAEMKTFWREIRVADSAYAPAKEMKCRTILQLLVHLSSTFQYDVSIFMISQSHIKF